MEEKPVFEGDMGNYSLGTLMFALDKWAISVLLKKNKHSSVKINIIICLRLCGRVKGWTSSCFLLELSKKGWSNPHWKLLNKYNSHGMKGSFSYEHYIR